MLLCMHGERFQTWAKKPLAPQHVHFAAETNRSRPGNPSKTQPYSTRNKDNRLLFHFRVLLSQPNQLGKGRGLEAMSSSSRRTSKLPCIVRYEAVKYWRLILATCYHNIACLGSIMYQTENELFSTLVNVHGIYQPRDRNDIIYKIIQLGGSRYSCICCTRISSGSNHYDFV